MEINNAVYIPDRHQESLTEGPVPGICNFRNFMDEFRQFIPQTTSDTYCIAVINILHFRLFNKLNGRGAGEELLDHIADCLLLLKKQHDSIIGYFEGNTFCAVLPWQMELIQKLRSDISSRIPTLSSAVGVIPVLGICPVDDNSLIPETFYDRATLALTYATIRRHTVCYDPKMEKYLDEEMQLLVEANEALSQGEFTFFVQPQCDIGTNKIVGAESLVRWRHRTKGLIPPGKFVPILERTGAIYLLDQQVWEKVCQWLRSWIDRGYRPVPISINISRIDIMSMDVPAYLTHLLEKYDLSAKYIKAEITESAYAEEDKTINDTVNQLRDAGFLVMMDDFGSGYSSLNMLKSIPVDVIKIDMRFLEIEESEEEKGISILESIVNMARLLGMPIIVEGVETQQQENVLWSMGCRYTQGYYYYKPLPIDKFETLLADERSLDFSGLHCKQVESFHIRELMDGNLFTDTMINNILGPSAIYDVYDQQIEISRVNEQYYRLSGLNADNNKELGKKIWDCVRDDDRAVFLSLFEQAYERRPAASEGNIHYLRVDGKVLWVQARVFFMREREGHRFFFLSLSDITSLREHRKEQTRENLPVADFNDQERTQLEQYCGSLPCGYGLSKVILNQAGEPVDYDILYINREMERMCGSDLNHIRYLILKAFGDDSAKLLRKAYKAAYWGETLTHYAYSSISSHYLQLTLFQYEYGYAACLLRDVTYMQLYEGAFNGMVLNYREVYFLNIRNNYCRMIYPEDTLITERGNYEAMVARHFASGKILEHDKENVTRFLSLEHLRDALMTQNSINFRYRRSAHDTPDEWCLTTVTVSEREKGKPKTAVITIQSIDKIMKEETEHRQVRLAESLANMSDAFFIYRAVKEEHILYANPALMELFGCTSMTELMEHVNYSFRGLVHPEDLNRVEWEIKDQIHVPSGSMDDFVQYRIIRKDGEIRWVDDFGHLETSKWGEEQRLFYVFLKDVTDTLTSVQKEKLLNSNQFY